MEVRFAMNKPWLWMLLSGLIGFGCAWVVNESRYGGPSRFGPLGTDTDLTAETANSYLEARAPGQGNPKIVVTGDLIHDFGVMTPGDEGEKVFEITNEGVSELELRLGASTCKCTIGSLDKESIAPGETTTVKLSWTVKANERTFSQSAQILTNDPANPALTFGISGRVIQDIDVVPEKWTFGEVASGDSFEVSGKIYNFMDYDIEPEKLRFSDPEMTKLSEFTVELFSPTKEADGIHSDARQAFNVRAAVKPGLRQGAFAPKLVFPFRSLVADDHVDSANEAQIDADLRILVPVSGRIVGELSMIVNDNVKEASGMYIYDLGRIQKNDPLTATAFVVLKGKERETVTLRVGDVSPDQVVKAKLGKPKGSGSMQLFPLEIELVPGSESVERQGLSKDDYGSVWIESDNPKVSKMRIALKFVLDGR